MMFEMRKAEVLRGTKEQEQIWRAMLVEEFNMVVDAKAGTGKTTTMVEGLRRMGIPGGGKKVGVCAFNRSAANELKEKVPRHVWAGTSHGLGYRILREHQPGIEVNNDKLWDWIKEAKEDFGIRYWRKGELSNLVQLVRQLKQIGWKQLKPLRQLSSSQREEIDGVCGKFNLRFHGDEDRMYDFALAALVYSSRNMKFVDFDDQIWLPYVLELEAEPFDLLVVDETQDLNQVQQYLTKKMGLRLVVVGDPNQSIYGFRGADTLAMKRFENYLSTTDRAVKKFPLTKCWRCPRKVIELARMIVPEIEAREDAEEGVVEVMSYQKSFREWRPGDMVLCRVNLALVRAVYRLWREGRKAFIQGRDVGDNLKRLVVYLKTEGAKNLGDMNGYLDEYEDREIEKLERRRGSRGGIAGIQDKCDCLRIIIDNSKDVNDLDQQLAKLFSDRANAGTMIQLSSIHRAKGLEANRVWLLEPEIIPHPMATQDWEEQQEMNCLYVAVTRSRRELYFVDSVPPHYLQEFPGQTEGRRSLLSERPPRIRARVGMDEILEQLEWAGDEDE